MRFARDCQILGRWSAEFRDQKHVFGRRPRHANDLTRIEKLAKIQTWHLEQFASFVKKMAETPDGQGSLLDHSIFMYGSNMIGSYLFVH